MIELSLDNKLYQKQIKYVLNYLLRNCNMDFHFSDSKYDDDLSINYLFNENIDVSKLKNSLVIIDSRKLFNKNYLKKEPNINNVQNIHYEGCKIYSLFSNNDKIYINHYEEKNVIVTNIDIVSDIFYMLPRYEEFFSEGKKDDYGRYKYEYSILNKHNLIEIPIVDIHYELFKKLLKGISKKIKFKNFPKISFISHDVDNLQKYYFFSKKMKHFIKGLFLDFKKKKNLLQLIKEYFNYKEDPYWMFDKFLEIEKKYNIISSYYLLLDDNEKIMKYNYKLLLKLLKKLNARNNEIGFHAGIETSNNSVKLENELENFKKLTNKEKVSLGCRQHYLKFDVKNTWDIQYDAGIKYDTSLAFPERVGFRAGTSKPFKVFSLERNIELDLWEIPLTAMDVTLLGSKYMNLSNNEAFNKVKELIDIVNKYNGVFNFLIHNSIFSDYSHDWILYYKQILENIYNSKVVNKTGIEIIDLYEKNQKMRL